MKKISLIILSLLFALAIHAQSTEKRIALIIGNNTYTNAPLKNPVNDANLMATTLQGLGFTVIKKVNASRAQMGQAIAEFWSKLGNYNVALFFYAGHGVQVNGVNYLIPVDATLESQDMVSFEAVSVNDVIAKFEEYPDNTNIVILDACRNNPFRSWARGGNRGFKAMNPGSGTIIAFATSEGSTASDGTGVNGLFTEKLVKNIKKPAPIETIFKNTRVDVQTACNGSQSPQEWTKLTGDFYFVKGAGNVANNKNTDNDISNTEEALPPGSIKLTSYINGTLFIDGKSKGQMVNGKVYTLRNIPEGSHQLKIGDWEQTVEIESNQTILAKAESSQTTQVNAESNKKTSGSFNINADFEMAGLKMRGIQGGTFTMGSTVETDETPHTVNVDNFAMMKYEVTQKEWTDIMGSNPSEFNNCDNCPVEQVSWLDVQEYIDKLNAKTGQTWRLPTEAEWEYAARGGQNYSYAGSDNLGDIAWNTDNSGSKTHPVGQKSPNAYGLYDMTGNVWEWCSDWYDAGYYKSSPSDNPKGASSGSNRVLRGGSWSNDAQYCRSAYRSHCTPVHHYIYIGFRLVFVP